MPRNSKPVVRSSWRARGSGPIGPMAGIPIAVTIAVVVAVALMVQTGTGNTTAASAGPSQAVPSGKPLARCGSQGQPSCPIDPGWVSIPVESPAAVAQAITQSSAFVAMQTRYGVTTLDTPTLVLATNLHTNIEYYDDDHWVVSVRDGAGAECGIFDFVYDRSHQRIRMSSFARLTPGDPRSTRAFPYTSASSAAARLQAGRGVAAAPTGQPELVFFPIDPQWRDLRSPKHNWSGGGDSPMDPMWRIVGADGHDYFVGVDMQVYDRLNLPFAPAQP